MEEVFPREIQAELDRARLERLKKSARLRVRAGEDENAVLRLWKSGFTVEKDGPMLRGFVDLYDGTFHLFQALIVTCSQEAGERHYEFKRITAVSDGPAADFERSENAPVALIPDKR